jgi:hypothetical protein
LWQRILNDIFTFTGIIRRRTLVWFVVGPREYFQLMSEDRKNALREHKQERMISNPAIGLLATELGTLVNQLTLRGSATAGRDRGRK